MSEVKRYGHISYLVEATPAIIQLYPAMTVYVLATDFDAAQSELAALREELAKSTKLLSQARSMVNGATDEWHNEAQKIIEGKRNGQ